MKRALEASPASTGAWTQRPVTDQRGALCLGCGYSLAGLPESRCPECGRAFDAHDPRTFRDLREPRWRYWWRTAPPMWLMITALGVAAWASVVASRPTNPHLCPTPPPAVLVSTLIIAVVTLLLLADIGMRLARVGLSKALLDKECRTTSRARFATLGLALTALLSLAVSSWPFQLRFWASSHSFRTEAVSFLTSGANSAGSRRVGLYHVKRIRRVPGPHGGVFFHIEDDLLSEAVGLLFTTSPAGKTSTIAEGWSVTILDP
jgi:hypothetical protein